MQLLLKLLLMLTVVKLEYDVEGVDESGKYELTYIYATNQIFEKREGDYHKSLKKKIF